MLQTRRQFLTGLSLTGADGLVGGQRAPAADVALETTKVRLFRLVRFASRLSTSPKGCCAPKVLPMSVMLNRGRSTYRARLRAGNTTSVWTCIGSHLGDRPRDRDHRAGWCACRCDELLARDEIHSIAELKGKNVVVFTGYWPQYAFLALVASQVGLDPKKDIGWIESP
jgi:hypothetical protein